MELLIKSCSKCLIEKSEDNFYKEKGKLSARCKICICEDVRKYANSPEGIASNKRYRQSSAYKESLEERNKSDKFKQYHKEYTKTKEFKESQRKYRTKNKHKINSWASKRRASLRKATPPWLNDLHVKEIDDIFKLARELQDSTGVDHNVDHIIPLNNPKVCGLHVPWNLQVIKATDNFKKSNKF